MKLYKQIRRERALARFTIQSETQWNNGQKGNKQVDGTYADYLERKRIERQALEGRRHNV